MERFFLSHHRLELPLPGKPVLNQVKYFPSAYGSKMCGGKYPISDINCVVNRIYLGLAILIG